MPTAKKNFLGLRRKKPAAVVYDLDEHAERAQELARQVAPARNYLVHAPGKYGAGKAWYWLGGLRMRSFEGAKDSGSPRRYLTGSSPWRGVRSNLSQYRDPEGVSFVVIDTFSGAVEGPLTLASIRTRTNPRRLRRNIGRMELRAAHRSAEALLQQLQSVKVGAQVLHWNARGERGYSDHLLFERVYTGMDEKIDTLAEKTRSYFGGEISPRALLPLADRILGEDGEMSVTVLAAAINHARALSDTLRVLTNEAHATHVLRTSPSGMDDFLMSLNSDLDTLYYLVAGVRGTD